MKKYLLLIFFSLSLLCVQSFTQTVAVFDFDCEDPDFADKVGMMTDLLIHELVKTPGVTVVERKNIDKVFSEYSFQANPYIDLKSAKKLGKGLGADCIIVGSIAGLGCPLYVTARMVDVESGKVLHSAKMTLNFWSDYEEKLPLFALDCVNKMPIPNFFVGVWQGSVSSDSFSDYYEVRFGEKSKCAVKVTSTDANGKEIVQEGTGTYSYTRDEFSGGLMFKLHVAFKGSKIPRLRTINWAYPININDERNSFSLNFPLDSQSDEMVRLTLTKEE